jgi:hypothetical protein
VTGREHPSQLVVDAVTDAAIAALLPADRRQSMTAHRLIVGLSAPQDAGLLCGELVVGEGPAL